MNEEPMLDRATARAREAHADQDRTISRRRHSLSTLAYERSRPAKVSSHAPSDPLTCQRTVLKDTTKLFKAKVKALQKCEEATTKGKHTDPCPCPGCGSGTTGKKAQDKVDQAVSKLRAGIDKGCSGANKICETLGNDNLDYATLFGVTECPNFENGSCQIL